MAVALSMNNSAEVLKIPFASTYPHLSTRWDGKCCKRAIASKPS
jgi:hypothetical protein